ncbi:hypothetical protein [Mesorhizobium sp. WSM3859]|uniref:hypothetical protein n=1 Tax=Mesorhizobium sp. WSM3859 TaxID=2029402 RepID=UPI001FDF32CC|nr:hypothetical protein [Mesorhizobium sp. WSM3859]
MFDVLEHIPDLGFLSRLKTRHLAVAVPYCRWRELGADGDTRFRTCHMRLPNEHLHTSTATRWWRCSRTTASNA